MAAFTRCTVPDPTFSSRAVFNIPTPRLSEARIGPVSSWRRATTTAILAIYNDVIVTSTAVYALEPATLDERRACKYPGGLR